MGILRTSPRRITWTTWCMLFSILTVVGVKGNRQKTHLISQSREDPFEMALRQTDDPFARKCLEYLQRWAPASDKSSPNITAAFLLTNVELAIAARNATTWARAVPEPVFLNDVLPYAVLSEPRGLPDWNWRSLFFKTYMPMVGALPNISAAVEAGINTQCWSITTPPIKFLGSPNCEINAYAPVTIIKQKYSSCTGLAVYVALAFRSVGIPARVAGTPHWNKCGAPAGKSQACAACPAGDLCTVGNQSSDDACGNHDWAEVFVDGAWHFVDPEGSKSLDSGWFVDNTKMQTVSVGSFLNHSIVASSWADSAYLQATYPEYYRPTTSKPISHFPMVWEWHNENVPGWDVTQRYLK